MIKTETIIVPPSKPSTREVKIYICDLCGYSTKQERINTYQASLATCTICDRQICTAYYQRKCCRVFNRHDDSDYPSSYCVICDKLRFEKYAKEIDDIETEANDKEEAVIEKIKVESLSTSLQ